MASRALSRVALWAAVLAGLVVAVPVRMEAASEPVVVTPWVELHGSRVRLIAGPLSGGAAPAYLAGIEVVLAEGWKTYWRMPGDAGVPPSFDWTKSTNAAAVKVLYPAPVRLMEPSAQSIGYKGTVLFPVEVKPRDAAKPVELDLALELGICRDICIPGEARLTLAVPTTGLAGTSPVAAWYKRVPRPQAKRGPGDPKLERVTASLEGAAPKLLIEASFPGGAKAPDVFIEAPDGIYVPMTRRLPDGPGGILRFESNLSRIDARDLKGRELTLTLVGDAGAATEAAWRLP